MGPDQPGAGWHALFHGGGSWELPTRSAKNMSDVLAGAVCLEGEQVPPHR